MVPLTTPHPLLQNIQIAINRVMSSSRGSHSSRELMTDKLRQDILNTLVSYSDKIAHPGAGFDNAAFVDASEVENEVDSQSVIHSHITNSRTLLRWQILAYVASLDLTVAKWFESHLDALSILAEVGYDKAAQGLWAVWAAEGPPLRFKLEGNQQGTISQQGAMTGTKAWCSGAHIVDYGLMTYRDDNGASQLAIVNMQQQGIAIDSSEWQAVGMQATNTATLQLNTVAASRVGLPNAYLDRAGFWHGAAGVAACWYGAASRLAAYLVASYQQKPNAYKAMYLGEISTALAITQQYAYHVAYLIDNQPQLNHELAIRQLRAQVEAMARQVLDTVGQALGAAPFCRDAHFARLAADLPVFIRQSHGAFDLQQIGELTAKSSNTLYDGLTDARGTIWAL